MKFMVVERLIGCPGEMSLGDDLHGVIRTTMQRAGSEFPRDSSQPSRVSCPQRSAF